ncbi:MAG: transcriptional repressor [Staphylococcus sp.]|nr:transcriptional repressor [Staphylococcus sp.]
MNEEKQKSEAESRLLHYLSQHHLRCTSERMMILHKVMELRGSFTPAALLRSLTDDGLRLSQGTVYNTLKLLETVGIVRKRPSEDGVDTYEAATRADEHLTLVCSRCGKVKELRDAQLVKLLKLRRYPSFTMNGFDLYIHGICSRCRGGGRPKK